MHPQHRKCLHAMLLASARLADSKGMLHNAVMDNSSSWSKRQLIICSQKKVTQTVVRLTLDKNMFVKIQKKNGRVKIRKSGSQAVEKGPSPVPPQRIPKT